MFITAPLDSNHEPITKICTHREERQHRTSHERYLESAQITMANKNHYRSPQRNATRKGTPAETFNRSYLWISSTSFSTLQIILSKTNTLKLRIPVTSFSQYQNQIPRQIKNTSRDINRIILCNPYISSTVDTAPTQPPGIAENFYRYPSPETHIIRKLRTTLARTIS